MSFVIKHRGAPAIRTTFADYFCEEHGRFEAQVDRNDQGDVPDTIPCPANDDCYGCGGQPSAPGAAWCNVCDGRATPCGRPAVWCISAPLARVNPIEAIKGKSEKPQFKTWTDTSAIGEGQPLYEWHEDRAKIWEEKRKADVMKFAREVHERPIGGD